MPTVDPIGQRLAAEGALDLLPCDAQLGHGVGKVLDCVDGRHLVYHDLSVLVVHHVGAFHIWRRGNGLWDALRGLWWHLRGLGCSGDPLIEEACNLEEVAGRFLVWQIIDGRFQCGLTFDAAAFAGMVGLHRLFLPGWRSRDGWLGSRPLLGRGIVLDLP